MNSKTKITATKEEATPTLVPKLRFPEFRGAEGWETKQLGNLCKIRTGKKDANEGASDGLYPFFTCAENHIFSNSYSFDAEAILIAGNANVGQTRYYRGKFEAYQRTYVLTDFSGISVPFLYAVLHAKLRESLLSHVQVSAMSYIKLPMLQEYALAVPPTPPEQQKIASCLSSVDELMTAQARKVDALKTHKKGLMQQLFPREGETQPRLRFPEFQNAGEWVEKKLGTVCDIQRGKFSHRPRNDPRFFGGQYPFIQTGDVVKSAGGAVIASQSLNEEGLAVSKLFKPPIVLITIAANIGDTGLLQTEGCFTDSVVGLIPKKDVIPVFLELIMRGQKENLNKVATTGAQRNINNEILREVSVLLPSIPEQQHIATCLTSLDALITAETQKHKALKTHKKGLMQQLFPSPIP